MLGTIYSSRLKFLYVNMANFECNLKIGIGEFLNSTRRTGTDGSMSASGSAGPGFDPRRGSKFSFENF